jgi:hypothetical protein
MRTSRPPTGIDDVHPSEEMDGVVAEPGQSVYLDLWESYLQPA